MYFGYIFDIGLTIALVVSLSLRVFSPSVLNINVYMMLSFIGALPVLKSAALALWRKKLTIDLLASIALIFSLLAGEWLSASFINLMLTFARLFDYWTEEKTKSVIQKLLKYKPEKVKVKENDKIKEIPIERVKVGDKIVIETGERIPVDGVIISGQAGINEATLTGESELVSKKAGDRVYTSTLNETGSLLVLAEKVGQDSRLSQIINLIEGASRKKADSEKIADKFTFWYILVMLVFSTVLYLTLRNTGLVLAVLLVICADDIAVAVPLSLTMGIIKSAGFGIVVKGGSVMENLVGIKYFITDKTGTLTRGKPRVTEINSFADIEEKEPLRLIGSAFVNSQHPVSKAVVAFLKEKQILSDAPDEFHEVPGEGIKVKVKNHTLIAGRMQYLIGNGVKFTKEQEKKIQAVKDRGFSVIVVAQADHAVCCFVLEDEVRRTAYDAIFRTKNLGIKKWVMLTGDNEKVAEKVATELKIDEFHANLTPEDKLKFIENFKKKNLGVLAMVGDGVNDAAGLAMSDVSFAMGAIGSDAAIEAADVALMRDNLERIPQSILIARATMRVIRQNFFIWGVTNAVGLLLVFLGILHPTGASAYNFVTDFFPIFNSLRISLINPRKSI